MTNKQEKQIKIREYQAFIDDTLKVDLKDIEAVLKRNFDKYRQWEELKDIINVLKQRKVALDGDDLNLRVSLGCGVHVNAETCSNSDRLLVDLGLGCYLEMNHIEAEKYCHIRMNVLHKQIKHFRAMAVQVKVKIKLTLLAINELQQTE